MTKFRLFVWLAIILVWIDGLLEMGLAESCLFFIMQGAGGPYTVANPGGPNPGIFFLNSEPQNLIVAPTRAASAAGAFGWTIMGFGGLAALLISNSRLRIKRWGRLVLTIWCWACVFCTLYTLAVVISLNVLVDMHEGQEIDVGIAQTLGEDTPYPLDSWTLPNFYSAVLNLDLAKNNADQVATANLILAHRNTMYSWRWNLVPLIIIQTVVCVLAFLDRRYTEKQRAMVASGTGKGEEGGDHVLEMRRNNKSSCGC
jgi:hypothetical protein